MAKPKPQTITIHNFLRLDPKTSQEKAVWVPVEALRRGEGGISVSLKASGQTIKPVAEPCVRLFRKDATSFRITAIGGIKGYQALKQHPGEYWPDPHDLVLEYQIICDATAGARPGPKPRPTKVGQMLPGEHGRIGAQAYNKDKAGLMVKAGASLLHTGAGIPIVYIGNGLCLLNLRGTWYEAEVVPQD